MMNQLQPQFFISHIRESEYPLWGILLGIVVFGVVVVGIRLRLTKSDIGDAGVILFNIYVGAEWGGGERAAK